ncbi:hypothetical protein ANN_07933 [Periplaneta americana]|uniref:Uncharacterized protein n=1 Tax=Periplaneta americana TaxID=6978 RepID=A0ABQ8T1K0_PERAM|nr:hypothetical protein ANN_07933 [Periplaneta americana]
MNDLKKTVKFSRPSQPFQIVQLEEIDFFNIQEIADLFISTTETKNITDIMDMSDIRKPIVIPIKKTQSDTEDLRCVSTLKEGVNIIY